MELSDISNGVIVIAFGNGQVEGDLVGASFSMGGQILEIREGVESIYLVIGKSEARLLAWVRSQGLWIVELVPQEENRKGSGFLGVQSKMGHAS